MKTKKYLDTGYDGIFLEETGEGYILSAPEKQIWQKFPHRPPMVEIREFARYAGCWGYSTGKGTKTLCAHNRKEEKMKYISIYEGRDWEENNESIPYTPAMDAAEIYDDWCGYMGDSGEWLEEDEEWWLEVLKDSHEGDKIREDLKQALGLIVSPDDWETLRKGLIGVLEKKEEE